MKRLIAMTFAAASMLIGIGCGNMESVDNGGASTGAKTRAVVPAPWDGNTGDSNLPNAGATVQIMTNASLMQQFTGHPVAQADQVFLNVQMDNFVDDNFAGHYAGYVSVSYDNNGEYKEGIMWSGESDHDTKYNVWYTDPTTGKRIFHAFFEDQPPPYPFTQTAGGVILVIDETVALGDGQAALDSVSGSLWFKNYRVATAPKPDTRCWFIEIGPYECQAWQVPWKDHKLVDPRKSIYPDNGYTRLGTFKGLNARDAFNM